MPHIEANGQSIYYELSGEGEPMLLVMGLGADHLSWSPQLAPFSQRYRVAVFDNRDVGRSSHAAGPYEIADMAADTLALADALELDRFHLVGVSMGGVISQELALRAPERVLTLTLCVSWGGNGEWGAAHSRAWGAAVMRSTHEERVDDLMLRCFSEEFFSSSRRVHYMRRLMLSNPYFQPPEAFVRQLEASGRHEARDRLPSLSLPTHVIAGEHDILVPPWKSRELAELIPDAELTVLSRAPHMLNLERADEFNDAVLDHLAAL